MQTEEELHRCSAPMRLYMWRWGESDLKSYNKIGIKSGPNHTMFHDSTYCVPGVFILGFYIYSNSFILLIVLPTTSSILISPCARMYDNQWGCKGLHHILSMSLAHLELGLEQQKKGCLQNLLWVCQLSVWIQRDHTQHFKLFSVQYPNIWVFSTLIPNFIKLLKVYCG